MKGELKAGSHDVVRRRLRLEESHEGRIESVVRLPSGAEGGGVVVLLCYVNLMKGELKDNHTWRRGA